LVELIAFAILCAMVRAINDGTLSRWPEAWGIED
jgi:hypothetical protein